MIYSTVSIKTRICFKNIQTEQWLGFLLTQNLQAITVHGRTVAGDALPADWTEIAKVVDMRNAYVEKQKQERISELKQRWIGGIG